MGFPTKQQPDVPRESILAELDRRQAYQKFVRSPALCRFLRFTIEETIAGRGDSLKEYPIGLKVFERNESFDPRLDPIVPVQARNLRSRLAAYYETEGASDKVLIELPKGGYTPVMRWREIAAGGAPIAKLGWLDPEWVRDNARVRLE